MKRVYINEEWCLGCHLCEYNCFYSNSGKSDMILACKGKSINSNLHIEDGASSVHFAFNCRHCEDPFCVKACIAGALSKGPDGVVVIDKSRCVHCTSCVMACPYGALVENHELDIMQKCELCSATGHEPLCVIGCPNRALVYEER